MVDVLSPADVPSPRSDIEWFDYLLHCVRISERLFGVMVERARNDLQICRGHIEIQVPIPADVAQETQLAVEALVGYFTDVAEIIPERTASPQRQRMVQETQQRNQQIRDRIQEGVSVRELSRQFGVSRQWIYQLTQDIRKKTI